MNIVLPDTITSLTASSNDPNLPALNLLHESPGVYWRAASDAVTSATVEFEAVVTAASAVVLHAVQAGTVVLEQWNGSAWATPAGLSSEQIVDAYTGSLASWYFRFTALTAGTRRMRLTVPRLAAGKIIQAGCLVFGEEITVTGVQYPLTEGLVDSSIALQMSDGTMNYRPRARWRQFSGTVLTDRAVGVPALLRRVARRFGSIPLAVHLVPDAGDEWFAWGRFGMPQAAHAWPTLGQVQFTIDEVL